ncbi:prohibitin family protein [Nibricoccus sp. IMCC34717]|uniref:prohibitin family protein n=1 Tax=Nibricoccus sp. IMCC34717 TaxID=3034021 RepID=UPI00384F9FB1
MNPARLIGSIILLVIVLVGLFQSSYVVEPGFGGVLVTLGKVDEAPRTAGFGFKQPFITHIINVPIRQQTRSVAAECYSSDLQQVNMQLRVLYRIPEASVVSIYKDYAGDPFESLIAPRVQEALKEVTALQSAEQIVKQREMIKNRALDSARQKIGDRLLIIQDLVIENITLSRELEAAIESKMVQEQEAAKARFIQQKAQIEADTAIIKAKGEAEAIRVRGDAIRQNPGLVQLQIVEKWDGKAPLVVGQQAGDGANFILPLHRPTEK